MPTTQQHHDRFSGILSEFGKIGHAFIDAARPELAQFVIAMFENLLGTVSNHFFPVAEAPKPEPLTAPPPEQKPQLVTSTAPTPAAPGAVSPAPSPDPSHGAGYNE